MFLSHTIPFDLHQRLATRLFEKIESDKIETDGDYIFIYLWQFRNFKIATVNRYLNQYGYHLHDWYVVDPFTKCFEINVLRSK